jgi:hypothetical protein
MGVITVSRARTVFGVALSVLLVALLAAGVLAGGGGKKGNDSIKLTGEAERPGPGDPDGSGRAALQIRPGAERVCFDLSWKNLDPVTMAHIHVGGEDVAGPVVVTLLMAGAEGLQTLSETRTKLSACTETFSPPEGMSNEELLRDIKRNPEDYYVNVHTTVFPPGAIRGQLED